MKSSIILEVFGDPALFSRPKMKVEHVSFDVITPSAAKKANAPQTANAAAHSILQ
jgi:CRISPR-associated Cas5-like protein